MGDRVQANLDDDLYDEVTKTSEETGKSKSEIVNEHVRYSVEGGDDWFMRSFAQSLFVVGFVIGYYARFYAGVGVSLLGLGLMVWFQMQDHAEAPNVGYWEAFKRTLGVH